MPRVAKKDPNTYDTLIVGAGISGLYAAVQLLKHGYRVAIAEKYKFLGGRTMTFRMDLSGQHYKWEEGAGRISDRHTLLHALLRRYKLTTIPIGNTVHYKESGAVPEDAATLEPAIPILLKPLTFLPADILANSTIRKLLTAIHGPRQTDDFLIRYPYRAEMDTMRADMALQLFQNEFGTEEGYSVCREGFSELVARMEKDIVQRGGKFLRHHELHRIRDSEAVFRVGRPSEGLGREEVVIRATKMIFAIPSESLKRLAPFSSSKWLRHLSMKPLLRVFAAFEPGTEWLKDIGRTITAQAPRYIIPNSDTSIQISYTDSTDAEPLMKILETQGEAALGAKILEELSTLFGKKIPAPLFVKAYPWKDGVTYWLPGDYDPYQLSRQACRPFPDKEWYVCGESYSTRQCWVEGALEHTDMMLKVFSKGK